MQIYNRADIVNFMGLTEKATSYIRMQGFTEAGRSLNASTYDRRYVDEKTERSDVTSYATEIGYALDRIVGNAVHNVIAKVHGEEIVGFSVPIVTVNFNEEMENGFKARMRLWSVQPDADGDSTEAYTYSGSFKANGDMIEGYATSNDGWQTVTFTAVGEQATHLVTFNISDEEGQVSGAKIQIDSSNIIYTDANGIAMIDLVSKNYANIAISKAGYTAQNNVSVNVATNPVYKEITLAKVA